MKLELKHLAAYLPYGLKICWDNIEVNKVITTMNTDGAENNEIAIDDVIDFQYQPILRPLLDLTNEISVDTPEHNGEKFVPTDWLIDEYYTIPMESHLNQLIDDNRWLSSMPYYLVEHLFEWHFDVFNLIEQGLAIDKNTL